MEVFLIAQLGHGAGDRMYAEATARQRAHPHFIDELDEPSTKLAGTDFDKGDATALYTFAVGPQGHPFHRHAGHRVFTAVTGSAGALLRFSTASDAQIAADPHSFIDALHHVRLPPDSLFTVRFGDGAWHQFAAPHAGSAHPVFFALSCHTDELGGPLPQAERDRVLSGDANLASLTELLPDAVLALLEDMPPDAAAIPTVALAFDAAPGQFPATPVRAGAWCAGQPARRDIPLAACARLHRRTRSARERAGGTSPALAAARGTRG